MRIWQITISKEETAMKRIKLYCYISAILCAALLLSSCVSDNAPESFNSMWEWLKIIYCIYCF